MTGEGQRPVVVGVAGGSGAGKSTVVRRVGELLGAADVAVLHHDAYYRDLSHLPPAERDSVNYDHPDALETSLLARHIQALLEGRDVDVPVYDFTEHVRRAETLRVEWRPVVITEGMFILADARLRELLDLKVYVDTPDPVRLDRRLRRDMVERGRSADSVMTQYRATVRPMHREFIEPSKAHADIVIVNGGDDGAGIDQLATRVRALVARVRGDR
jgi:uridine kinase